MTETDQKRTADRPAEDASGSALDDLREQLERSGSRLQKGRRVSIPGDGDVPARSLMAAAIFIGAFVVVYLLCWAALGGAGLFLGILVGGAAGLFAAKLYADRAGPTADADG